MLDFNGGITRCQSTVDFAELATGTLTAKIVVFGNFQSGTFFGTDREWRADLQGGQVRNFFGNTSGTTSTAILESGVMYHLAYVFDTTSSGTYIDGVADPPPTALSKVTPGADRELAIGTRSFQPNQGLNHCQLEDVRLYDRVLSQVEVREIAFGQGKDSLIDGLIHHWACNRYAKGEVTTGEIDIVGNLNLTNVINSPFSIEGTTIIK